MKQEKDFSKRKPDGHSRLERMDMEAQSWIYAPTRLSIQIVGADGNVLSLTEQQIMQGINAKLQPYIRRYFSLTADERKQEYGLAENMDRLQPLFRPDKNGKLPDTPVMEFDATDIVGRAHFSDLKGYANRMLNIKVDVKATEDILDSNGSAARSARNLPLEYRRESIFPLFSKITCETTGEKHEQTTKGSGDVKEFETYTGKIIAKINPEISNYVFNMRAGVIEQPRFLAKYAKCKYTPIFYALLKRQIGINKVDTVAFDYTHVKRWANLPPDETGPRKKDEKGKSIPREWHSMYSQFRRRVLEEVRYDLIQMCEQNHSDMYIDYEPLYRTAGNHRSSPDKIRFYLFLSYVGERRKEYKKTKKMEPGIFAESQQNNDKNNDVQVIQGSDGARVTYGDVKIRDLFSEQTEEIIAKQQIAVGAGADLWKQLLADYSGPAKSLLSRAKYIGLDGGRFYFQIPREDAMAWKDTDTSSLDLAARQLLHITSFMPAYRYTTADCP